MDSSSTHSLPARFEQWLSRFFLLKTVLFSLLVGFFFQVPSFNEIPDARPFQCIVEIGDNLFSQQDYPTNSHIAKKTLRPLLPGISRLLNIRNEWTIYGLFCALNIILLCLVAMFFVRETNKPVLSMMLTVGMANTYFGFSGFLDVQGWGDILPFVLIMITMQNRNRTVNVLCVFLASLGDERALLSIPFIFLWKWYKLNQLSFSLDRDSLKTLALEGLSLGFGFLGWLVVRAWMVKSLVFSIQTGGVGPQIIFCHQTSYIFPGWWSAFEAYWIPVLAFLVATMLQNRKLMSLIVGTYLCLFVVSCYFVLDLSRSLSYGFPVVLLSIVYLVSFSREAQEKGCLWVSCLAIVNVLTPTVRIHGVMRIASPVFVQILKILSP